MIDIVESQLFTSDVELTASLFTFLFDLEILKVDDKIKVKISAQQVITLILKDSISNELVLRVKDEEKTALFNKLELFNYKNKAHVNIDEEFRFTLGNDVLFSVI